MPTAWLPQWLPRKLASTRMLPLTCCFRVDLIGSYSNRQDLADTLVSAMQQLRKAQAATDEPAFSVRSAKSPRQWRVGDRLSEADTAARRGLHRGHIEAEAGRALRHQREQRQAAHPAVRGWRHDSSRVVDRMVADAEPHDDGFPVNLGQPEQRPAIWRGKAPRHRVVRANPVDAQGPRPRHSTSVRPHQELGAEGYAPLARTACGVPLAVAAGR
jgi:hypothetical protein